MNTQQEALALADKYFEEGIQTGIANTFGDYYHLFEKAAAIYLKYNKWEKYIEARRLIAYSYMQRSKLGKALKMMKENLQLHEEKIPENILIKIGLLKNLSLVYFNLQEYKKAEVTSQLALKNSIATGNIIEKAIAYEILGNINVHTYKPQEALSYYFKTLKLYQDIHKKKNVSNEIPFTYFNIAFVYKSLEQFELSKNYFLKAHYMFMEAYGNHYPILMNVRTVLGELACLQKQFAISLKWYQEAQKIQEYHQLRTTYTAALFANIGELYAKQNKWEQTWHYLQQAINLQKENSSEDYEWFITIYSNIVKLLIEEQKWEKAAFYIEKVLALTTQLRSNQVIMRALTYLQYGQLFYEQQKFQDALVFIDKAFVCYQKATDNKKKHEKTLLKIRILQIQLYQKLFQKLQELTYLQKALRIVPSIHQLISHLRTTTFQETDQIQLNQQVTHFYQIIIDVWFEHFSWKGNKTSLFKAFQVAEKNKVHALLSNLKNAEALHLANIPSNACKAIQKMKFKIIDVEKKVKTALKMKDQAKQDEAAQELIQLQIAYHQFIKKLEAQYPAYLQLKSQLPSITLKELQNLLKPQTALIEYEITQEYLYIFCLSSTDIQVKRQPLPTDFDRQLNYLIDDGILGLNRKKYVQAAYQMYQCLVEPILPFLQYYDIRHLQLIPDNQLLELPFEALLTTPISYKSSYRAFPYLIRDYSIQYHYSATLWAYQQKRVKKTPQHQAEFMGFAPVYSYGQVEELPTMVEATRAVNIGGVDYQALIYSEKEVQDIQASFAAIGKSSQIHLRTDANLQHFKKSLQKSSVKYLHIAAHSVLSEEEEELVGILFSPVQVANSAIISTNAALVKRTASDSDVDTSDMVLYPNEVAQLSLESDLVFLSCCKSGVGKLVEGEGMLSINRSFLSAGVSNIVFTLFKIYDRKTPILTQHFYEAILQQSKSYTEALQYAKQQMIRMGIAPKFWSGFLLLGQ